MPDLLLELLSEEIPARMQPRAAEDLRRLVTDRLVAAGLVYEGAKAFATPRRLALTVMGVPVKQPDAREERKGPRVGAPEGAIKGFLRAAGLKSIAEAKVAPDKKGDFYVAVIEKAGRPAIEVIAEILPEVIRTFPWPKSMRWGKQSATPGALGWVRPLHSIVATFGPETEEPEIVPFAVGGIAAGDETRGHRFLAPAAFKVRRFEDYAAKLAKAKVVLDPERRRETILADAKNLVFAQGYELVEDPGLLAEVAGLVEWPVVLMGSFDETFLAIPPEVIRATIRNNQKCFVLRDPGASPFETRPSAAPQGEAPPHPEEARSAVSKDEGRLANKFILVANIEAPDGGKAIVAGNERVIRARLADAKFFYETDLKMRLEDRLPKFEHIVFHEKLGTQAERLERIDRLASNQLASVVKENISMISLAVRLCKADLLTEVVAEFPELQGLMGKYYALAQGEDPRVAAACEDHYKPQGPTDRVPTDLISVAVGLADKIDALVAFWTINERPTGSKDPYALRRAALGIIRLVLNNDLRISLSNCFATAYINLIHGIWKHGRLLGVQEDKFFHFPTSVYEEGGIRYSAYPDIDPNLTYGEFPGNEDRFITVLQTLDGGTGWFRDEVRWFVPLSDVKVQLLAFFADRLKVQLREQGARHDLVDAVFALEGQDDLMLIVRRVEALGKFLDSEDGKNLLAGYKRATNIIRIEERRDKAEYTGEPSAELYRQAEEWELARAIDTTAAEAAAAVAREDFAAAMSAMAKLRPHVDAYFDKVTVNVDDAPVRANRLKLLNQIRAATRAVADFSKIEG